jgi:hypothetical protein
MDEANAYRGVLLSMNKINPMLKGRVEIVSDCLRAMNRVSCLPPYRIPS